jgi:hypothetical protein
MISNYSLRLAGLGHRPQITNHSRACTQALLLYISPIRPARVNQYPHWYLHFLELSLLTSIFNSEIWIKNNRPDRARWGVFRVHVQADKKTSTRTELEGGCLASMCKQTRKTSTQTEAVGVILQLT